MSASVRSRSPLRWAVRVVVLFFLLGELVAVTGAAPPFVAIAYALGITSLLFAWRWPYVPLILNVAVACLGWESPFALEVVYFMIVSSSGLRWVILLPTAAVFIANSGLWRYALDTSTVVVPLMTAAVVTIITAALGILVHTRRALESALDELRESHIHEREASMKLAVDAERERISQEMHHVVSHQVSLIAAEAQTMQRETTDASAKRGARVILDLSASTIAELRYILVALSPDGSSEEDPGAMPLLDRLETLIRHSGMDVSTTIRLDGCPPAALELSLYRIAQEGLTNVRKHAPGAVVHVALVSTDDLIVLTIENSAPKHPAEPSFPASGHGLVGVRERVDLLGGQLQSGPNPDGGFRLTARIPRAYESAP